MKSTLKTIFCLLIIMISVVTNLWAQNSAADSQIVMQKLQKMKKELNLSQKQVDTLKPLLLDDYMRNEMIKKNITVIHNVQQQNIQSTEYEMSKILSPEQYKLYQQNKEIKKAKMKDQRIREKMAFYKLELQLTDQQYTDLKLQMEKFSAQRDLLKEQYKNNDAMLKVEMIKLRNGFNEKVKKILTKDQLEKFQELRNTGKK